MSPTDQHASIEVRMSLNQGRNFYPFIFIFDPRPLKKLWIPGADNTLIFKETSLRYLFLLNSYTSLTVVFFREGRRGMQKPEWHWGPDKKRERGDQASKWHNRCHPFQLCRENHLSHIFMLHCVVAQKLSFRRFFSSNGTIFTSL